MADANVAAERGMTRDELIEELCNCTGPGEAMQHIDRYVEDDRERIAQAIERDGYDPSKYTMTHPFGNTSRLMQLVRDDCARIARAES